MIGKNTIDAIRAGVVYGYAGAIDAILRALGIDAVDRYCGQDLYRFWKGTDEYCAIIR